MDRLLIHLERTTLYIVELNSFLAGIQFHFYDTPQTWQIKQEPHGAAVGLRSYAYVLQGISVLYYTTILIQKIMSVRYM